MSNEKYTFLPWLRKGLSSAITVQENTNPNLCPLLRSSVQAKVTLNTGEVEKSFMLRGPGDINSIAQSSILRTEPIHGIENYEWNYLPYVEFFEEDFPWRYTPAVADDSTQTSEARLSPWICLIALKDNEFTINTDIPGKQYLTLTTLAVPANIFPPADQLWAWAHVQVNKQYSGSPSQIQAELIDDITADSNLALSRIICPRKLDANTAYTCFLIPTFESGLKTALGEDPSETRSLKRAWGDGTFPTNIPFYYSWEFKTDDESDFEQLANLIEPVSVPAEDVGREMYIGDPGMGMDDIVLPAGLDVIKLEGALMPPLDALPPLITAVEDSEGALPYQEYYSHIQNLVDLTGSGTTTAEDLPFGESFDPGVLPPLYGQWHAQSNQVENTATPWLKELNLDPRNRVAASIGTRIVKENQEDFMEQAWEQVEQIQQANQRIRQAELTARVGQAMFDKHILHPKEDISTDAVAESRLLRMTSGLHHTLAMSNQVANSITVKKHLSESRIPDALLTPAFRRITRPSKSYCKVLAAHRQAPLTSDLIAKVNKPARPNEEYPLYPKPMAPVDAVRTDFLLEASRVVEKRMHNLSNQGNNGNTFDSIPAEESVDDAANNSASFTNALKNVSNYIEEKEPLAKSIADAENAGTRLRNVLAPMNAVLSKLRTNVEVWSDAEEQFVPVSSIEPIMAYPEIDQPMYELLKEISPDYIIPNLHKLPENSATVMKVNMRFLESLFVGLNHEMSRELLWREYPTDQRGSYIRTFWDKSDSIGTPTEENNYDINNELHAWNAGLGDNNESETPYLVLVLRGKLLQKFPDTVIFAQQAEFVNPLTGTPTQQQIKDAPRKLKTNGLSIFPEFTAKLGTDVTLAAFNMTRQMALGQNGDGDYLASDAGYYFALQERPGQLRFGADENDVGSFQYWNDLSWETLNNVSILNASVGISPPSNNNEGFAWGRSSADMASILAQQPVLFLVHSKNMII